ncbi:hypothetical protein QUF80_21690, partial [Desulfococcaceae bacterium HSG8]|nr:hypothetical protein [Desulfococcaceae bacterium HSG8]
GESRRSERSSRSARQDGASLELSSEDSGFVSANPEVTVRWDSSSDDPEEKYYYVFNKDGAFGFTKRTAPRTRPVGTRRTTSPKLEGDNIAYYFHVAPVNARGRIGETVTIGFRIDTVPPSNLSVTAPRFILTRSVPLTIGVTGASEMYISNTGHGQDGKWEKWQKENEWQLTGDEGEKKIFVRFRDRAGNTSDTIAVTEIVTSLPELHTVTAESGEHGSISPSGETEVYGGSDLTFTITPDEDWLTDRLFIDGEPVTLSEDGTYTLGNITGDVSVAVTFKEKQVVTYTVTATAGPGGTISPSGEVTVKEKSEIIFKITPDPGYEIERLLADGKLMGLKEDNTFQIINVRKDYVLSVSFREQGSD